MNADPEATPKGLSPKFEKAVLLWSLPWDADWITAVSFVGPRHVAAGNNRGDILLWALPEKPEPAPAPEGKAPPAADMGMRPLHAAIAPARQLVGHTNVIARLVCAADRWLISASYDHTLRYWDLQAPTGANTRVVLNARAIDEISRNRNSGRKVPAPNEAQVLTQPSAKSIEGREWVTSMGLSHDQSALITGDDAGNVTLYNRTTGVESRRWQVKGWAQAVALAPDQKQAFASERYPLVFDSGRHTGAKLWDATAGTAQHDLAPQFKGVQIAAAAYSADGKVLAVGRGGEADGNNGKVTLLDPAAGKTIRELTPGHQYGITDLCFHPDKIHLATAGRDTLVRLWNFQTGQLVKELGKPRGGQFKDWICAIAFSPDGGHLAAADMAGWVHLWRLSG